MRKAFKANRQKVAEINSRTEDNLSGIRVVKSFANEGPCVIVGRCADYALADFDNVLNLFIYADDAFKCNYIKFHKY